MMRIKRIISVMLTAALMLAMFSGCGKSSGKQSDSTKRFSSFRDVPGVTAEEISAIEALQKQYTSSVYGVTPSIKAF